MKNNTLVHSHEFGPGITLELLYEFSSNNNIWNFNMCFLENPILFNFTNDSTGNIIYVITKEAIGGESKNKKYIGNHAFEFKLQTSIYKILSASVFQLSQKLDKDESPFSAFQYSGCLEKMEIYAGNTIKVYLSEYYNSNFEEDDMFVEAEKYAINYYAVPPRAKGYRINRLLNEILGEKVHFIIESIYEEDRAIFSITEIKKTQVNINIKIAYARKLGINITKIGKRYIYKNEFAEYGKQNYLIVDESGLNFKKLNVFEETLAKVELNPMDIYFKRKYDWEDDIFSELLFLKSAPVSVFQKTEGLTLFEKEIKALFDVTLPIPFSGIAQITYNSVFSDDEEGEQIPEINFDLEIHNVREAKTIKNILEKVLQNEDKYCWVRRIRYLGNGELLIYISYEENDFIRDNDKLYNALLKDGYAIHVLFNNRISFKKQDTYFSIHADIFEPLIITVSYGFNDYSYNQEVKNPLTEKKMRAEMIKFLPGLSDWNCIPAFINERCFMQVVDVFNAVDEEESIEGYNGAEEYAAMSLKFLHTQRRNITYKLPTNSNPINQLVTTVNLHEKNVFGKTYFIKEAKKMKNTLAQKPKGFGKYTFQDLNILTKANGMPIGNIILWKYEQKNDLVTIEYSIQKTSKELIMKIPFTKLTKGKKKII